MNLMVLSYYTIVYFLNNHIGCETILFCDMVCYLRTCIMYHLVLFDTNQLKLHNNNFPGRPRVLL